MIITIPQTPDNIAAFKGTDEITKADFEACVIPHIKAKINEFDELNYLFLMSTDLKNFSTGAWVEDVMLGIKNLTKWNRAAIVSNDSKVQNFTEIVSKLMPGEFRAYVEDDLQLAMNWCATGNENIK